MSYDSTRSGNSNSNTNSKRSFNSISSNNNVKSGNKRKKNSNQKTLGASWGANSSSSSRSSFRTAPFSDFGSYMAVKNKKLHDQFDAQASNSYNESDSSKPLFQGVSIFVDGFTIPSSQELRAYMLKHGGRFENYFSRRRVTHIICSNLPDSKIKNLRSFSRGLPVVKPTWVLDCVAAGKLLSWAPYQLDQITNDASNQPKLSAFFSLKRDAVREDVSSASTCMLKVETEAEAVGSEVNDDHSLDHASINVDELSECSRPSEKVMEDGGCKQIDTKHTVDQTYGDEASSELEIGKSVTYKGEFEPGLARSSASASSSDLSKKLTEESPGRHSVHRDSATVDPNFVENYFKSSRLHFIGTWRSRYRKRFASFSNYMKQPMADVNGTSVSRKTTIIHIDMDCFFVAVVIRHQPELMGKPVAVCHSDSARGTAEISSANYPARHYGVKAGMFVKDAKARCPQLVIVPYNFEAYEEVAEQFYNILHKHCNKVQAVSCDEAFLDVSDSEVTDPELLVSEIRKEILEATGCTASAGIGENMLMARLATKTAKPDGQCYIPPEKVDEYLLQLSIKSLPGIGHVLEQKLKKKGVQTCGELRMFSKEALQRDFGAKTGEMLWNYCRGLDNRLVGFIQESKSIGADVNWGVRFKDTKDSERFLMSLCNEVSLRLRGCGLQGRTFTLKIKKRRKDAGEPIKYMGCGDCENFSHSMTVPVATAEVDILQRITMQLFGSFHIDVKDIRGIGLQVTKLESDDNTKQGHERNTLRSWLASGTTSSGKQCNLHDTGQYCLEPAGPPAMILNPSLVGPHSDTSAVLPSLNDLDMGVIESLPPELFSEYNNSYGGRLFDLISKSKGKASLHSISAMLGKEVEGEIRYEGKAHASVDAQIDYIKERDKAGCSENQENKALPVSGSSSVIVASALESEPNNIMPLSLSQVDMSILQQLPDELRADIIGVLPAHRGSNCLPVSCHVSGEAHGVELAVNNTESKEYAKDNNLWTGNPFCWVHKFKASDCLMLNILADMFVGSGSSGLFSSALQYCLSGFQIFNDVAAYMDDEAMYSVCELLRQYVKLKLEADIEEIYVCFRLLSRLASKSKAFKDVYNAVLPYVQASITESYGGHLHLPAM
ncbi:DNA repair protein REV1 isoform X3 [Amaranthus tricolor]|uniref:DNA repair protein REV1 isoform X3 n=1 Tax=Amaranthus tricolor TaxID=29722 RepID=UPI00258583B2|nr:DNA repair protein REV1 isoform X3 [Amaranthus tricolor]